jgi:hypothetical protein
MSDPIGDRLRAYYRSIQDETPARLGPNVSRAFDTAAPPRGRTFSWRPAAGLAMVGVAVLVAALVLRGIGPATTSATESPAETPTLPSTAPTASPTSEPMPTPTATPTDEPTASPTPTPSPSPTATPTPTTGPSRITLQPDLPIGQFGTPFSNSVGRMNYTATLLADGRVLVVGGVNFGDEPPVGRLTVAQLWNPSTGKFTATGSLNEPRTDHTATLLADGRVLVVGGADLSDGIDNQATAEIYDPGSGTFTMTGSMARGRAYHTATLLDNGKVLIAGGYGGGTIPMASAEVYDPGSGTFSATGSMSVPRDRHTATLLPNGSVLIAGGVDDEGNALASAEIYNPGTGRFAPTGSLNEGLYGAAASPFSDPTHPGSHYVLVVGGTGSSGQALASAEVYDIAHSGFGLTPAPMSTARRTPTVALIPTYGYVLAVGAGPGAVTADVFNTSSAKFTSLGSAGAGAGQTATLLKDCRILLSGSSGKNWEIYTAPGTCPH